MEYIAEDPLTTKNKTIAYLESQLKEAREQVATLVDAIRQVEMDMISLSNHGRDLYNEGYNDAHAEVETEARFAYNDGYAEGFEQGQAQGRDGW